MQTAAGKLLCCMLELSTLELEGHATVLSNGLGDATLRGTYVCFWSSTASCFPHTSTASFPLPSHVLPYPLLLDLIPIRLCMFGLHTAV